MLDTTEASNANALFGFTGIVAILEEARRR